MNVVAVLFPGLWRRLHRHLDAGVQVRIDHLPVTLVLASLPEGDPGRQVQVGGPHVTAVATCIDTCGVEPVFVSSNTGCPRR